MNINIQILHFFVKLKGDIKLNTVNTVQNDQKASAADVDEGVLEKYILRKGLQSYNCPFKSKEKGYQVENYM